MSKSPRLPAQQPPGQIFQLSGREANKVGSQGTGGAVL